MKFLNRWATIFGTVSLVSFSTIAAHSLQLADGTIFFAKSPRLLNVTASYQSVNIPAAKYYFTLELPENAGEPLQKITIKQRRGVEVVNFRLEETLAFTGEYRHRGENLTLDSVSQDEANNNISVAFDPPIQPGTTFTVGLKTRRNPRYSGVYLFGVTAFPVGVKPYGLYLGVGRLHFYDGNGNFIFH